MTMQSTTTADLSCEEIHAGFDALIKRIAEIAAVRDVAIKMASQATKDLVQARHEHKAELDLYDNLVSSLRLNDDRKNDDLRRLTARVHELALANEDLQRQLETARQQRPERTSWLSRRIGNSL